MGLCKCRVVTNLFCFDHKKNVCERCIFADHQRCIIRSYLQWLQDSDYESTCGICKQGLDSGAVVRLCCIDLFHVRCLDDYAARLPENTPSAAYACPTCNVPIIPPPTTETQIANNIRDVFANSIWAQRMLPKKPAAATEPFLGSNAGGVQATKANTKSLLGGDVSLVPTARGATASLRSPRTPAATGAEAAFPTNGAYAPWANAPSAISAQKDSIGGPDPGLYPRGSAFPLGRGNIGDRDDDERSKYSRRHSRGNLAVWGFLSSILGEVNVRCGRTTPRRVVLYVLLFFIVFLFFTGTVFKPPPSEVDVIERPPGRARNAAPGGGGNGGNGVGSREKRAAVDGGGGGGGLPPEMFGRDAQAGDEEDDEAFGRERSDSLSLDS